MSEWDAISQGFALVAAWPAIGFLLLGTILGLYFGAIPGLGGLVGFSLLIPFTFKMSTGSSIAILLGMFAVTTTGDNLTAILLGVPSAISAAIVIDGYPMTQRGEGLRALGAAYMTAILSGVIGALALAVSVPIIRPLILSFAPPEFFMLGLLGLAFVGTLAGRSISKGLLAALLGMLLSTVGYAPRGGMSRYSFDITYLLDGINIIPVALGLFALPEIVTLAVTQMPIAKIDLSKAQTKGQLLLGIKDALREWRLVLRSSVLGIYIGMLPGVGAIVAEWAAYGMTVQLAKDKSMFGKGDVRGVIGPEASTHSVKGAELIPTMAFGIPATAAMSILMGALLIHGISPGPEMLTSNLPVTFSLVWTLILANIIGALLLMQWSRQIAKLIFVRANLIVPGIILVCFMGAWMANMDIGDWYVLLPFAVLGLAMKRAGLARPPLILGFVLGPVMEKNLDLSYQALGWSWVERPMVIAIFGVLVVSLFFGIRTFRKQRQNLLSGAEAEHAGLAMGSNIGVDKLLQTKVSAVIATVALVLFTTALWMAKDWTYDARFFPGVICMIGIPLALISLLLDVRAWRAESRRRVAEGAPAKGRREFPQILAMFGFFLCIIGLSMLIGQMLALPIAMAAYLLWWGKESWKIAAGQAAAGFLFLFVVFDQIIQVSWIDSWWTPPF